MTATFRPRRASSQATGFLCDAITLVVIATALGAIVGWVIRNPTLVRLLPDYPPLYPGSALGLAAAAAGLWGLAHRSPRWVLTGGCVLVLLGGLARSSTRPVWIWGSIACCLCGASSRTSGGTGSPAAW